MKLLRFDGKPLTSCMLGVAALVLLFNAFLFVSGVHYAWVKEAREAHLLGSAFFYFLATQAWLWARGWQPFVLPFSSPLALLFLSTSIYAFVSPLWSYNPALSWGYVWTPVGLGLVAVATAQLARVDLAALRKGLMLVLGGAWAFEGLALAAQWAHLPLGEWAAHAPLFQIGGRLAPMGDWLQQSLFVLSLGGVPSSGFGNPNYISEWLLLSAPFLAGALWGASWLRRGACLFVAVTTVGEVVALGSRMAFLALVVSLGLGFFLFGKRVFRKVERKYLLAGLLGGLFLLGATTAVFGGRLQEKLRPGSDAKNISIGSRLVHWELAWEVVKAHPLMGVGPGSLKLLYPQLLETRFMREAEVPEYVTEALFEQAHNDPLQILAEFGLLGLVLVGLLYGGSLKNGVQGRLPAHLALGLVVGLFGVLIASFSEFPFQIPATAYTAAALLGLAGTDLERESPRLVSEASPLPIVMAFLAALLAARGAQEQAQQLLLADRARLLSGELLQSGKAEALLDLVHSSQPMERSRARSLNFEYKALILEKKAEEILKRIHESAQDGNYIETLFWRAESEYLLRNYASALKDFSRVAHLYPADSAFGDAARKRIVELHKKQNLLRSLEVR